MKKLSVLGIIFLGNLFSVLAQAQEFDFSNPKIDKAPVKEVKKDDIPLGSFGGLNLGLLFDVRYTHTQ